MKLIIICILSLTAMASAKDAKGRQEKFFENLFYEVAKANEGKSVVMSPLSVLLPLAPLALASVGESHDELLKAIGMPNDNVTKEIISNINQQILSVTGVELRMANRIYIANDAALNEEFAESSKKDFNFDFQNIDFWNNEAAADEINDWVEYHTNHKIKELVKSSMIDTQTRAMLINAIYFQGKWVNKFNVTNTKNKDFYVSYNKIIQVPTMTGRHELKYAESALLQAKILEMPYEGYDASFLVVLPNKVDGISDLLESLRDTSTLSEAVKEMNMFEVDVSLPKFKIETTTNLKKVLQEVGIKKLFTFDANLNNMLDDESDFFITDAIQKAFIDVNEDGATAAAATATILIGAGPSIKEIRAFNADHPFVFFLKIGDNTLFSGVYQS